MKLNFLQVWQELNRTTKLVVVVLLLVAVAASYKSCTSQSTLDKFRKEYNQYKDTVAVTLHNAELLKIQARKDSLAAEAAVARADSLRKRITQLNSVNQQLHHQNDSLATVVLSDTTLSPEARTLITNLQTENTGLRNQIALYAAQDSANILAIGNFKLALAAQTARGDSLEKRLNALPQTPKSDKLLGFIPLPSRTVVFFVGTATGLVLSRVIK